MQHISVPTGGKIWMVSVKEGRIDALSFLERLGVISNSWENLETRDLSLFILEASAPLRNKASLLSVHSWTRLTSFYPSERNP